MKRLIRSIGAAGTLYHVVRFSVLGAVTIAWAGGLYDMDLGMVALVFAAPGLTVTGLFIGLLIQPSNKLVLSMTRFSGTVIVAADAIGVYRAATSGTGVGGVVGGLGLVLLLDVLLLVVLFVAGLWHHRNTTVRNASLPKPEIEEVEGH